MPLLLGTIQNDIIEAETELREDKRHLDSNPEMDSAALLEAEIRLLTTESRIPIKQRLGFDRMDAEAMESLLLNELQMSSRETDQSIEYYDKLISTCEEDHSRLLQINSDLSSILSSFESQREENSKQIESLMSSESSIYESDVHSYSRNTSRLQRANAILIGEVKSLLTTCYGDRCTVLSDGTKVRLSTEILTILQECINKVLKTSPDRYVTLTPEQATSEAVQLLLSANLIQKDKVDNCKFRIVDFYS